MRLFLDQCAIDPGSSAESLIDNVVRIFCGLQLTELVGRNGLGSNNPLERVEKGARLGVPGGDEATDNPTNGCRNTLDIASVKQICEKIKQRYPIFELLRQRVRRWFFGSGAWWGHTES